MQRERIKPVPRACRAGGNQYRITRKAGTKTMPMPTPMSTRPAVAAVTEYASVDDIFALAEERGEAPFIVVCDEISDVHNLGAVIRSAECAGANAKRLGLHTPCAEFGQCDDCASPERICSVTAFFERPSKGLENTYVILADCNLGL